jgi:hypothetical protein
MPASKVDRPGYAPEPARGTKAAPAPKNAAQAAGKDSSRLSPGAPQLVSLRDSSHPTNGTGETKQSLLGALRDRLGRRGSVADIGGVSEEASMQTKPWAEANDTSLGLQTASARATVSTTGGHGSNRESERTMAVSNGMPNSATDNTVQLLLNQVAALESRASNLAARLADAAGQLHSGGIPAEGLGSDLALFQAEVKTLQGQTVELARSLSVPADAATAPAEAFRGLRAVLAAIRETQQRNLFRKMHEQAARELESVLGIEPRGGMELAPLEESKRAADQLLAEIRGVQWPNSHPECLPLVERRHACSRLLDLVRDSERLTDTDWETAQEVVAQALGRPLAIAAVRGRLQMKSGSAALAQAVSHCPTCEAELEPGAKFCGDCGVRIE